MSASNRASFGGHSGASRRREERKRAKFAAAGENSTINTDSVYTSPGEAEGETDPSSVKSRPQVVFPGAFRSGGIDVAIGGDVDADVDVDADAEEEDGAETRFDDLSTLSPNTFNDSTPVTAELVPRHSSNPDVQQIVAEVLRQQQLRQNARPPGREAEESTDPEASAQPPPRKPPVAAEAVVIEQKTICGMSRSKFILGAAILVLLAGLGIALAVIFGTNDGGGSQSQEGNLEPPDQSPVLPPIAPTPDPTPAPQFASPPATPPSTFDTDVGSIVLQAKLTGEHGNDRYGAYNEFSRDGKTFAIGASGARPYVQILRDNGTPNWDLAGRIQSGTGNTFGHRLDLDELGETIVIGAPRDDDTGNDSGKVQVFSNTDVGEWTKKGGDIFGTGAGTFFGWDVAISDDGNIIISTSRTGNFGGQTNSGNARVYRFDDSSRDWIQLGPDITGEADGDEFGRSCGISGDGTRVAIGAVIGPKKSGSAYVYEYNGTSWEPLGQRLDGEASEDYQGTSIDISGDGNYLAIGSDGYDGVGINSGTVKVYKLTESRDWFKYGDFVMGTSAGEILGAGQVSISWDGQALAVGGIGHSGRQGVAYMYKFIEGNWRLVDSSRGESDGDEFGFSVCVAGDASRFAAGAPRGGNVPGYVRMFSVE